MIAALLAWQLAAVPQTTITYHDVPREDVQAIVYVWREGEAPVRPPGQTAHTARDAATVQVRGVPGRRSIVTLVRTDGSYLIDGPFTWPDSDADRATPGVWRRTWPVRGPADLPVDAEFQWVSTGSESQDAWPHCFRTSDRAIDCWGVRSGASGVLMSAVAGRVWWTVSLGSPPPDLQSSAWGRLLIASNRGADPERMTVTFARPAPPSAQRRAQVRVDTAALPDAHFVPVAAGAMWVYGEHVPPGEAWAKLRSARAGPKYISLEEISQASAALPLWISLEDTRGLDGHVRGQRDEPAPGALVTLFRVIDPPASLDPASRQRPRKVFAGEVVADEDGAFHLDGLGEADYEIVAWHAQLGRATVPVPKAAGDMAVRLASPGQVRGRILSGGKPIAGVDVISLPDPQAFQRAEDMLDVKGGDGRTAADGRFAVVVAAGGGGELRVGGGTYPIKRIPLPRAPLPLIDLGDIDLGTPIELTIVLDQDPGCDVRATGPVGHTGLQIVLATRTGPGLFHIIVPEEGTWEFHLACGRDERAVTPPLMQIGAAQAGKEVRLSVR